MCNVISGGRSAEHRGDDAMKTHHRPIRSWEKDNDGMAQGWDVIVGIGMQQHTFTSSAQSESGQNGLNNKRAKGDQLGERMYTHTHTHTHRNGNAIAGWQANGNDDWPAGNTH